MNVSGLKKQVFGTGAIHNMNHIYVCILYLKRSRQKYHIHCTMYILNIHIFIELKVDTIYVCIYTYIRK